MKQKKRHGRLGYQEMGELGGFFPIICRFDFKQSLSVYFPLYLQTILLAFPFACFRLFV